MRRVLVLSASFLIGAFLFAQADSVPVVVSSSPVQSGTVTTDSTGAFSFTFTTPFKSTTPGTWAFSTPGATGSGAKPQVTSCQMDTMTNPTTAPVVTGHCATSAPQQTLGSTGETALATTSVMVFGMDRTQP